MSTTIPHSVISRSLPTSPYSFTLSPSSSTRSPPSSSSPPHRQQSSSPPPPPRQQSTSPTTPRTPSPFKRKRLPSPPPQKSQQRVEQLRQFKLRESREDRETNWLGQERKTHRQVARRVRRKSDEDGVGKIVRSVGFRIHTEAIEEKKYGEKRSESVPSTRRGRETNEDYAEMMGQLLQSALEGSKETEEKGHSSSQDRHCHATKVTGAPS